MNKTLVYLAAPWLDRDEMPQRAEQFERNGCVITHKWWYEESKEEDYKEAFLAQCGHDDINGVKDAELVVVFNTSKSEGKSVEQGIAIALGKPILIIGTRGEHSKNVFHYTYHYTWITDINEAIGKVKEWQQQSKLYESQRYLGAQGKNAQQMLGNSLQSTYAKSLIPVGTLLGGAAPAKTTF